MGGDQSPSAVRGRGLPAIGDNLIPNAQHVVVGVLMLAMVLTSIALAVRTW